MSNPQTDYDVETYAEIEVSCSGARCGLTATFDDAYLLGDSHTLRFAWVCPNCLTKNIEDLDTDKYVGDEW